LRPPSADRITRWCGHSGATNKPNNRFPRFRGIDPRSSQIRCSQPELVLGKHVLLLSQQRVPSPLCLRILVNLSAAMKALRTADRSLSVIGGRARREDQRQTISRARRCVIGLGAFTRTYLGTFTGPRTPCRTAAPPAATEM
jgi:hypothetical protein